MSTLRRNAGVPSSVYGSAPGRQPRDWPSSFPVRIEIDESNELPLTSGLAGIARVTTSRESTVVPIAVLRYVTKDRAIVAVVTGETDEGGFGPLPGEVHVAEGGRYVFWEYRSIIVHVSQTPRDERCPSPTHLMLVPSVECTAFSRTPTDRLRLTSEPPTPMLIRREHQSAPAPTSN